MRLGEWKTGVNFQKAQNISWRNWEKREGAFLILALFAPAKYPSWTLSFLDEEQNLRVRKSLDDETGKDIARILKDVEGKAYLVLKKNEQNNAFEVYIDIQKDENYSYNKEGRALILRRKKEDIPF
ncbi:MAG TPA: hypothetical protein ENF67_01605 [Candidatus Pacearchaeota archaeon]|nr:hypothetical protein [Candidatus Pacearchaeota archaeon]